MRMQYSDAQQKRLSICGHLAQIHTFFLTNLLHGSIILFPLLLYPFQQEGSHLLPDNVLVDV